MAGWTAKKLTNGNFKFKKHHRTETERETYIQDGFLQRFVMNMQRLQASTTTDEISTFELPADRIPPTRTNSVPNVSTDSFV